ncbi:COQ9-domain-containing protein [Haematococcus lacustris]
MRRDMLRWVTGSFGSSLWPRRSLQQLFHHGMCSQAVDQEAHGGDNSVRWQQQLLDAALPHVGLYGWSNGALEAAARDLGLSPAVIGLLPRGKARLVEHFMQQCNQQVAAQLQEQRSKGLLEGLPQRAILAQALRHRLRLITPHIDSWPQALACVAHAPHAPHALRLLSAWVDEVWALAGDTSTDLSWYSRRALLAGVYVSTELYLLTDYSPGFRDSWQALERRLDEALSLEGSADEIREAAVRAWREASRVVMKGPAASPGAWPS